MMLNQFKSRLLKQASQVQFWWRDKMQGRHNQMCLERVDDLNLLVLPEVFNPTLFGSSVFLAHYLRDNYGQYSKVKKVLDLGCGAGILGLTAAKSGLNVIATDINPAAVRATRLNALLNDLETKLEARQGSLFEPVVNEKFDLILNNPPYFAKDPQTKLEQAFFAGAKQETLQAILANLAAHLSPHGHALLVVNDNIGFNAVLNRTDLGGLSYSIVAQQTWWAEKQLIFQFSYSS